VYLLFNPLVLFGVVYFGYYYYLNGMKLEKGFGSYCVNKKNHGHDSKRLNGPAKNCQKLLHWKLM